MLLLRVPYARNVILVARKRGPLPLVDPDGPGARLVAVGGPIGRELSMRQLPGGWRRIDDASGGTLLTDDHCPIERLQFRSIAEGHAARSAERDS